MTGPYDESYPPEILRGYTPPVIVGGAARRTATRTPVPSSTRLTVTEGAPATYEPELEVSERPRTLDELDERAQPATPAPWAAGSFVLYANGKRAHWSGDEWRSHESPGYPSPRAGGDASRSAELDGSMTSDDALDDEPDENPDESEVDR